VEDKWQRDEDAPRRGSARDQLVEDPERGVEFDFGKARVVRGGHGVSKCGRRWRPPSAGKGRIILLTKLQQGDLGNDVVGPAGPQSAVSLSITGPVCAPLFKAKELDRSICDPRPSLRPLMEYAPADG